VALMVRFTVSDAEHVWVSCVKDIS